MRCDQAGIQPPAVLPGGLRSRAARSLPGRLLTRRLAACGRPYDATNGHRGVPPTPFGAVHRTRSVSKTEPVQLQWICLGHNLIPNAGLS